MKAWQLIQQLQKMPQNKEVCITDWRKNLHNADDEPNGIGIESQFKVEYIKEDVNKPFIALSFENDDYEKDGSPNYGASILNVKD